MTKQDIEVDFPKLQERGFQITSPKDIKYNCIAYAANDMKRKWWPFASWPLGAPKEESLVAFIIAFQMIGYNQVGLLETDLEIGFDKVAIYGLPIIGPQHASIQFADKGGIWKSKLGDEQDIEHHIDGICGSKYGFLMAVLKRHISKRPNPFIR